MESLELLIIPVCISYICNTYLKRIITSYFLNFFLPIPAIPIKPEPKRSIVAGSGTEVGAKLMALSRTSAQPIFFCRLPGP